MTPALPGVTLAEPLPPRPLTACWLGRATATGEPVFVKVLASREPGVRANFRREVAALRALRGHPGVPRLVTADVEGAVWFHACAVVPGRHLGQVACRTVEDAVRIAARLAERVAALHAAGWAHRDLSPDHVFAGGADLTVVDFGLARPVDAGGAAYDVQCVGLVLWELLCGQPVFAYRSGALGAQAAAEAAVLADVALPAGVAAALRRCLLARTEVTPDGAATPPPARELALLLR